jgi:RNA polymerase sigma-70 factor, ECF subfamily
MNDKAFELIFEEHHAMVTAYLQSVTGNKDDAAELAQETFIVAYKKLNEFDRTRSVAAWLRGIAQNLARNTLRKKSRQRMILLEGDELDAVFSTFDNLRTDDLWQDRLKALLECRGRLPDSQRQSVALYYDEGKPPRDIATALGVVEKSVYQILWIARKNLKQCIEALAPMEKTAHGS